MPTHPQSVLAPVPDGDHAPDPAPPATVATVAALLGGLLVVAAPAFGIVRPATGPAVLAAGIVSVGCAVLAPLLALAALARRRFAVAGALLAGAGSVAIGSAVVDLALWVDPINANRLELFRPVSAMHLAAGPGVAALFVGHLLVVVGGVAGLVAVTRAAQADGYGLGEGPGFDGAPVARRVGPVPAVAAVGAALLIVAGAFGVPWTTTDPVLVVHPLLGSDAPTAIGVAFVAVAVLVVVAAALASESTEVAGAAVAGAALGALGLFGARAVVGLVAGGGVSVAVGSAVAAVAALALIAVGLTLPVAARVRAGASQSQRRSRRIVTAPAAGADARVRQARWHAFAGGAGIVAGLLAAVGSVLPVLTAPDGTDLPQLLSARVVLVAGLVLLIASAVLLLSEFAAAVRPAVGILWVAQLTAVSAVLQAVVVASDVPGIGIGPGAVLLGLSVVAAVGTGLLSWQAGSVERDAVGAPVADTPRRAVLLAGVPAAAVSVIALALPLYTGAGYVPATVADWPWGWDLWGRGVLAVALVIAVLVAARARPARAAAGALGAATSMGVYLIGWPATIGRIVEPEIGSGSWAAIMGVVLFVVTAVVAVRPHRR